MREQDITYDIGVRLRDLLQANPNFDVRLSRNTPTEQLGTSNVTSLQERVNMSNAWDADFFISLHCNSSTITSASGCEAYAFSQESEGFVMGASICRWLSYSTGLQNRGVFVRPSLYVLRATVMPSVLIEMGFLTNEWDVFLLRNDPQSFARGIYNGILAYYGLIQ